MQEILQSPMGALFIVVSTGLILGRLRIRGSSIGVAGVLVSGLVFGHLGLEVPSVILSLGTILFVTAVGLTAGRGLKRVLGHFGFAFFALAFITIAAGFLASVFLARALSISGGLAVGMMAGALTSTPGLGAALEATGGDPLVGVAYAVTYPLGVFGVVSGANLTMRLARSRDKRSLVSPGRQEEDARATGTAGLLPLSLIMMLGILAGYIPIPVPWVGHINLGLAGGPLVVAMFCGHLGRVGPYTLAFTPDSLNLQRDLGAVFILAAVGTSAGSHFVALVVEHGLGLLLGGLAVTVVSALASIWACLMLFRLDAVTAMGALSGAMTSTPGLAASVELSGTEEPGVAYAAVYPIAIILNCLAAKIMVGLLA